MSPSRNRPSFFQLSSRLQDTNREIAELIVRKSEITLELKDIDERVEQLSAAVTRIKDEILEYASQPNNG